jgi:hypothetical protein
MAEVTAFTFNHAEIVSLMVRERGIHEGLWQLSVEFGFAASNVGPDADHLSPTGLVGIVKLGVLKVPDSTQRSSLIVDAAEVNPPK